MKAAQIDKYGGTEVVTINEDAPKPIPAPGQVLVEVHAAGVNPVDWKIRQGYMGEKFPLPAMLGGDFSGIIVEIGGGVSGFKKGDEVYGYASLLAGGSGSFAEFAAANVKNTAPKPRNLRHLEAAALPLAGASAWQALVDHMGLAKGQKTLIHGGAGGIGSIAIQIAKFLGAYVAATVSTRDLQFVKELGADEAIDYKKQSFEDLLNDYDAVYDTVGGETYWRSFKVLKKGGVIVSMLEQPDTDLMNQYGVKAIGQFTKVTTERLAKIAELVDKGAIKILIDKTFPLGEAREALSYLQKGHPRGKVVLQIKED